MPIIRLPRKRRLASLSFMLALSICIYVILFSTSSRTDLRQFIEKRSMHGKLSFANSKCFLQKLEFNTAFTLGWIPRTAESCQSTKNFIQLIETPDSDYTISLDIDGLTKEYNLEDNNLIQCHAFLVKDTEKKYYLSIENEFRIPLPKPGVYTIACMEHMESAVFYETVETVLPTNMSDLMPRINKPDQVVDTYQAPLQASTCKKYWGQSQIQSTLSVLVIILEDMSYNQFRRVLPNTFQYLREDLNTVVFDNLMVVSEDSKDNLISMLAGSEQNDAEIVWKDFEKLGYISMYNDAENGISQFKNQQVNYDTSEFWNTFKGLKSIASCQNKANVFMSQVSQFVGQMHRKQQPYIAVNVLKEDGNNKQVDQILHKHLLDMDSKGYLTNTLVMLTSDRAGSISTFGSEVFSQFAALEFPNLFLSVRLPKIFRSSPLATQIHSNQNKLITPFDLHKTLKHFSSIVTNVTDSDLNSNVLESIKGRSLFQEIAQNRSCQEAHVPANVCPCIDRFDIDEEQFQKETKLELLDAANFIVGELNEHTEPVRSLCKRFRLNTVQSSKRVFLDGHTDRNVFELVILLQPGQALFKALIEIEEYALIKLRSPIERLNLNVHSKCLKTDDTSLKDSCYCKNQIHIV